MQYHTKIIKISMNIKKLWMSVFALLLSSTVIFAQEQGIKEEGKTAFNPHWFM